MSNQQNSLDWSAYQQPESVPNQVWSRIESTIESRKQSWLEKIIKSYGPTFKASFAGAFLLVISFGLWQYQSNKTDVLNQYLESHLTPIDSVEIQFNIEDIDII